MGLCGEGGGVSFGKLSNMWIGSVTPYLKGIKKPLNFEKHVVNNNCHPFPGTPKF